MKAIKGWITGLDHVQLAMPAGKEDDARRFYGELLGLDEVKKPAPLDSRGGCWFEGPGCVLHLGVEARFEPAKKAHPGFVVHDLGACVAALRAAGIEVVDDLTQPDVRHVYIADPFGNRLELVQDGDGFSQRAAHPYPLRIETYARDKIACIEYDPTAPRLAKRLAQAIEHNLDEVSVEHIGSTAVPGCAGKGVIDLLVLYADGKLERVKQRLAELGYQPQSGRDPFPETRPMRLGSVRFFSTWFCIHVHVVQKDANEARELIDFRDALRSDAALLAAYVAEKKAILASGVTDGVDYANAKTGFIRSALASHRPRIRESM